MFNPIYSEVEPVKSFYFEIMLWESLCSYIYLI